ncbi:hypothetical protein PAAL66ix_20344 [Paenibacillus alvei A6-6i-x]|nr:hypothetical protein PAAL66ix_20344 [Paenibacillus alvei A6-6i-x]
MTMIEAGWDKDPVSHAMLWSDKKIHIIGASGKWKSITIYSLLSIHSFQIGLENPIFGKLKQMPPMLIF